MQGGQSRVMFGIWVWVDLPVIGAGGSFGNGVRDGMGSTMVSLGKGCS